MEDLRLGVWRKGRRNVEMHDTFDVRGNDGRFLIKLVNRGGMMLPMKRRCKFTPKSFLSLNSRGSLW